MHLNATENGSFCSTPKKAIVGSGRMHSLCGLTITDPKGHGEINPSRIRPEGACVAHMHMLFEHLYFTMGVVPIHNTIALNLRP